MRHALCDFSCALVGGAMPAIASLEDLKAAQKDLQEAKDLNELKAAFKKWRRIGWKNVCKLWLQERTPEQLKGEGE
jgi:hypothetical protein